MLFQREFVLALLIVSSPVYAVPKLFDIVVSGGKEVIEIDPQNLSLEPNQEYVFIFYNQKDYPVSLTYGDFGKKIATQFLQGTSNVNHDGFTLLPENKLTWHFIAQTPGEFTMVASNISLNLKSNDVLIKINEPLKVPQGDKLVENKELTAEPEKTSLPNKFRLSL